MVALAAALTAVVVTGVLAIRQVHTLELRRTPAPTQEAALAATPDPTEPPSGTTGPVPTQRKTMPAETAIPAAISTLPPVSTYNEEYERRQYTEEEQVELIWGWALALAEGQRYSVTVEGPAGVTSKAVPFPAYETKYAFRPADEVLEPGLYRWHVCVEEEDEGKWEALPNTQSGVRMFTVLGSTPTPTPATQPGWPPPYAAPTPTSQIVALQPLSPGQGTTLGNPVTFRWSGSLGPGQAYQVTARHLVSGKIVPSPLLTSDTWATHLQAELFGEWRWTASIVQDGSPVANSEEWHFYFQPHTGDGEGEDKPTPEDEPPHR
jgi:hypothetical protein